MHSNSSYYTTITDSETNQPTTIGKNQTQVIFKFNVTNLSVTDAQLADKTSPQYLALEREFIEQVCIVFTYIITLW